MLLYEQFTRDKNDKFKYVYDMLGKIYESSHSTNARILGGELEVSLRPYDGFRFKLYDIIYTIIKSGNSYKLSDTTSNNINDQIDYIYSNIKILANFINLKNKNVTLDIYRYFNEKYDDDKYKDFYKDFLKHFKIKPEYLNLIDWPIEFINTLSREDKNLIGNIKTINRFNI